MSKKLSKLDQFIEERIIGKKYSRAEVITLLNIHKTNILWLLANKKSEMTISEIQRDLGISYKETYRHISELIKLGFLTREKRNNEKNHPVYIKLKKK